MPLHPPLDISAQPLETFVQTITTGGAGSLWENRSNRSDERRCYSSYLDVPRPLPEALETELVSNLRCIHGVGQILLVGENKKQRITKLILVQHALKFLTSFRNTFTIIGVNNENDSLGVLEICKGELQKGTEDMVE